ncbi:bacterial Ig-like domain-containing protein [Lactococcus petauri]|uniref:bacterial Ig-like domain-containing protein n=1 Tax=Lactococcus petauri TaxID=1940789 RepID=UPI00254C979C|nr:bacterial Ig-like domain-containing protein [Lactococcus petauri]
MTTSTILPGITATVSASTRNNTVSQNSILSQVVESDKISEENENIDNLKDYKSADTFNYEIDAEKSEKESDDIASGVFGTSNWRIDSEGVLHIYEGKFDSLINIFKSPWEEYSDNILKIKFEGPVEAAYSSYNLFSKLNLVSSFINISYLDVSNVKSMSYFFEGMSSLTSLDLSSFDTRNVTDMRNMFSGTSSLTALDLSNFDTSNVTSMGGMFNGMSSLTSLDLSNFDTSNVTNMVNMFRGMSSLSQVTLGDSFTFAESSDFPGPDKSNEYTGNWINIATGTIDSPLGENIWSPAEMMANYNPEIDADTYVWERTVAAEDVTVRYVDSQGEEIHSSQNISGNVGDDYDASTSAYKLIIDGYTLDESKLPENATGKLGDKAQTVTYVYNKNKALGSVTLRYVDTFGQPIEDFMFGHVIGSQTFEGEVGNSADDDFWFIDAVGWVRISELPTGVVYSDSPQTFDIVYDRAGTIYVNYEDTNGIKLKPEWRNTDYLSQFDWATGEYPSTVAYEVSPLDIPGYEMIRVEGDSAKGVIDASDIKHVTFVYSKPVVVNVHDSTLYVGDEWSPEANFDSALDKDGKAVDFKDVKVAGEVDTTKAGSYEVSYSYGGVESKATITVKDNQTAVNVHDSILYVGDEWSPEANFDSALDKDGKAVDFKDVKVSGNVDTTKAGNYNITYSYDGLEETATITVIKIEEEQDLAHIVVHDSELKVGDDWSPQDNFDKATSSDGKEVSFSDVVVSGAVDTEKPGTYEVTYSIPEDHWVRNIVEGRHTATAKIVVSEEKDNDDRDSNSKGENSDSDKNNSSSTDNISGKNDFQNTKRLPKTGEHTSALIFMMGISFLVLGSIFSVLRIKKNKK